MTDDLHVPVLKEETLRLLQPKEGMRIIDGTFGFGGHSRAFLESGAEVLGLDLDAVAQDACAELSTEFPGLSCRRSSFKDLEAALSSVGWKQVDGVLLDLGVSSFQLDDPDKGFSYRTDGPLDLRFNQEAGQSAAELIARSDETTLANLIWQFGQERASRRIARAVMRAHREEPVETTGRLRDIVVGVLPRGIKTAPTLSRVFQALRIVVNDEMAALTETLEKLPLVIKPGGCFVVISYHSLEDRLVKQFIDREKRDCLCPPQLPKCVCGHTRLLKPLTKGAVQADDNEQQRNPRSRSARLRAARILTGGKP